MIKLKNASAGLMLLFLCLIWSCSKVVIDESAVEPIEETIKYDPDIKKVMSMHCISCHGGNNPVAGINLETYENVRFFIEDGNLIDRINDMANPMPPSGLMPADKIQLVEKWIEDGFIEN